MCEIHRLVAAIIVSVFAVSPMASQQPDSVAYGVPSLADHINLGGYNVIVADEDIIDLLQPDRNVADVQENKVSSKRIVYRVQVFSDNKAEKSKQEAMTKERAVKRRFPDYTSSIVYTSPYWRLHIGAFRSAAEAEELAIKLRKAFPAYAKEIHVVRARATVTR